MRKSTRTSFSPLSEPLSALGGSGGKFAREIQVGLELEEEGFVKVCGFVCDISLLK